MPRVKYVGWISDLVRAREEVVRAESVGQLIEHVLSKAKRQVPLERLIVLVNGAPARDLLARLGDDDVVVIMGETGGG
ncbi:MAG: MoaD/ThiS family protein [Desulfurococcaceae archaeon]